MVVSYGGGLLLGNALLFGPLHLDDPLRALSGLVLAWGLGCAAGAFLAGFGGRQGGIERFAALFFRPLFWISGVFFVANELPQRLIGWLRWNPLLHAAEIMRSGSFAGYESTIASPLVPVVFILLLSLAVLSGGSASGGEHG